MLKLGRSWQVGLHAGRPSRRYPGCVASIRHDSTATTASSVESVTSASHDDPSGTRKEVSFYVDTVFPIKLGMWDIRYLLALFEKESIEERIRRNIPKDTGHGLRVEKVQARQKDGGAFVTCSYLPDVPAPGQPDTALRDITEQVIKAYNDKAERPWYSLLPSRAHLVQGRPWQEDILNRFPSPTLRIEFESGPELSPEQVFSLFRPYGRIRDLEPQPASNKDVPRFANVTYTSTRMAAAARNSLYGYKYDTGNGLTTLRILYKERVKAHAFREWITSHPRIVIPIVAVLAGGLSYAIFDPIRKFFVRSKVSGLFDLDKYRITKWLKKETIGRLGSIPLLGLGSRDAAGIADGTGIEIERMEAAQKLRQWLSDMPDTFITVTGPPGSGKTPLVEGVAQTAKNLLVIDCNEIVRQGKGSDAKLVAALATQLGYYPQFQWASSFSNLIDIASVGLIGTKAGFATNLDVQIKQVLDVSAGALKSLADEAKTHRDQAARVERLKREMETQELSWVSNIRNGSVHDGRLDCVAANGIMGELGVGIEKSDDSMSQIWGPESFSRAELALQRVLPEDVQTGDIDRLPIVIIKNFDTKGDATNVLWAQMADWAATLVENKIAHCIFVNDNVAVSRSLARALPSKPFSSITLTDATSENALQYVQKKLKEYGKEDLAAEATATSIERLGGRLTDLETLIQKMRGGTRIEEAVDDIVARSSTELVKNCFGDDADEAKNLPWSREQVWYLVKALSKQPELSYADQLVSGPFKDNEKALHALEQAEVIMIVHRDGRAATVRPGKPSYRSAFQNLASDAVFAAQNELALNAKAAASASAAVKSAQDELVQLSQLFVGGKWTFGGTSTIPLEIAQRVDECLRKMHKGQEDVARLSEEASKLKEQLRRV